MIRISFETETDSCDPDKPGWWRMEAADILRHIADRIENGENMPIRLYDRIGNSIGMARELSYLPEPG